MTLRHGRGASGLLLAGLAAAFVAQAQAFQGDLRGELVGTFAFGPCAAGAPAGAQCLHDRVSGRLEPLGDVTGEFDVVIDSMAAGADGCAPVHKEGTFTASAGDLRVTADGRYCYATSTATYAYTLEGGTGRYSQARGEGDWDVPAPTHFGGTGGEGTETVSGSITYPEPTPTASPTPEPAATHLEIVSARGSGRRARVTVSCRGRVRAVRAVLLRRGHELGGERLASLSGRRRILIRSRSRLREGRRYVVRVTGRKGRRLVTDRAAFEAKLGSGAVALRYEPRSM